MTLRCSFCCKGEPDVSLVFARNGAVICIWRVETAFRSLHSPRIPFDKIKADLRKTISIVERSRSSNIHLIHSRGS